MPIAEGFSQHKIGRVTCSQLMELGASCCAKMGLRTTIDNHRELAVWFFTSFIA